MKRRMFVGTVTSSLAAGCSSFAGRNARPRWQSPREVKGGVGGYTPQELLKEYRFWLYEDFLPFMDSYVIDHELGGFMCAVDRDGARVNTNKTAWYEGRGIWTYSFLHNKLTHDPKHLDIARKSVDFVMRIKPAGDARWPASFQKDGTAIPGNADIYGDLFIAHGLQEFAKAKGNERYWDQAKDILLRRMKSYDSPGYTYSVTYAVPSGPPPAITGPRVLGHWMIFLNLANQMLEMRPDPEVEAVATRSIDAIMNSHFNPDFGLMNEVISHDMSRNPDYAQFSYTGHATETLWMVMAEALRRGDKALFELAAERFRRHVEVSWDDVYGGGFRALYNVDGNVWEVGKVTWQQEEILNGTLLLVDQAGDDWAKEWYAKTWRYAIEKLSLRPYGFPLWVVSGDRKNTFVRKANRCEHFHHPRQLMQGILALERIIGRGGKV
jgi:N-acylglucosamine 2-epimerase